MLKRLGLILLMAMGLAGPAMAAHFDCVAAAVCSGNSTLPCDWATAASWTSCNADYPHNGANVFTATIGNGFHVMLATDALTIGDSASAVAPLTINGTLTFSEAASGRDAGNFRTLTIIPSSGGASAVAITLASTGAFKGSAGSRIFFDTTAGNTANINITSPGVWDFNGDVVKTTIYQVPAAPASNNTLCGTSDLQYYVLPVQSNIEHARVGRRIVFQSGQLRNRQYEIVAVNKNINALCLAASSPFAFCTGAGTGTGLGYHGGIGFCTDLVDGTGVTCAAGASCGQRLRGHSTIGQFPTATPPANTRHWTPAETPGNDICSASKVPHPYCTAANAGTGYAIYPLSGDTIAIVDDVWLRTSAGTVGWAFNLTNASVMPVFRAMNLVGGNGIGVTSTSSGGIPNDITYDNVHEYTASSPISTTGFANYRAQWNAVHDAASTAVDSAGGISPNPYAVSTAPAADNVQVTDNIIYRTRGNGINFESAAVTGAGVATGATVARNLVFENCTTDVAECGGIEVNACKNCRVNNNIVYDIVETTPSLNQHGDCYRLSVAGPATDVKGSSFDHNIGVNCGRNGVEMDATAGGSQGWAITHNYLSNVYYRAVTGGRLYGNILRNVDISLQQFPVAISTVLAKGNFLIPHDAAVVSGYCAGNGNCWHEGFETGTSSTYLPTCPSTVTYSDNIIVGGTSDHSNLTWGIGLIGTCVTAATITHTTFDGGGSSGNAIDFVEFGVGWAPAASSTASITDTVVLSLNNGEIGKCSTQANTAESFGTYMGSRSSITADQVDGSSTPFANSGSCTSLGTRFDPTVAQTSGGGIGYLDRLNMDFNLTPGSPVLTAGVGGSALGARAFNFSRASMNAMWGNGFPFDLSAGDPTGATIPPFPKNVSNGTSNADSDGDGVIDLFDNCPAIWNPSQLDSDSNGVGDACGG